jgi:hypothetical protein
MRFLCKTWGSIDRLTVFVTVYFKMAIVAVAFYVACRELFGCPSHKNPQAVLSGFFITQYNLNPLVL